MFVKSQKNTKASVELMLLALQGQEPAKHDLLCDAASRIADWNEVASTAVRHRVAPWMLESLSLSGCTTLVSADALDTLRSNGRMHALTALMLDETLDRILEDFSQAQIPCLVLKGPAIASLLYPKQSLRPYGDLDLLVPLVHRQKVIAICQARGYERLEG
jgi:hypothetical protein